MRRSALSWRALRWPRDGLVRRVTHLSFPRLTHEQQQPEHRLVGTKEISRSTPHSLWYTEDGEAASITVVCLLITVLALTAGGAADDSDEPGASSAEGDETLATGSPDVGGTDDGPSSPRRRSSCPAASTAWS